ncbi:MAG: tetratricopeptide repeat protein [Labedaea sp.]
MTSPAQHFYARLRALRVEAGEPSYGDLAKAAAGLPNRTLAKQTVSDLLNGNSQPRWKTVETFVLACKQYAKQKRIQLPDSTFDRKRWRTEFDRAWACGRQLADGPLREPYRTPDTAETPVRLLRAEYAVVPFQNRDELTVLLDWCRQVAAGTWTGLAVVHGVGGAGKTRLALELAHRLGGEGWYAGVLPKGSDPAQLAAVTGPVAVVVDYADGRVAETIALLRTLRVRSRLPSVVVLTARSVEGQWLTDIASSLDDDRHTCSREEIRLPDEHPNSGDIYRRTVAALRPGDSLTPAVATPAPGIRWTTLDLVLLGWIATAGATALPSSRALLYDEVLRHEENYWCTVYDRFRTDVEPDRVLLRKAAVVASLLAPAEPHIDDVLSAVGDLRDDPRERRAVRRTLLTCLCPGAGEGLAVRPDPVGEHLLLREFVHDPALLVAALSRADDAQAETALRTLDSAGQLDSDAAIAMIVAVGEADPGRWRSILVVAGERTGPAETALERLADRPDTPLPLDELSRILPWSDVALFKLGLIVDGRRLEKARVADQPPAVIAGLLENVSRRAGMAGDATLSLTAIAEAIDHYRALAMTDAAAHLPGLSQSLTNLAVAQSNLGEYGSALTTCREAIDITRDLATTDAGYLPELAQTLSNLGWLLSEDGQHEQALVACQEAVDLSRKLTAEDGSAAPRLIRSLHVLSTVSSNLGRLQQALMADREAVELSRGLAARDTRYLRELARSLNNLGATLITSRREQEALDACDEAARLFRALGGNDLGVLVYLVRALNNVSSALSHLRRNEQAVAVSHESVTISRKLADANPAHEPLHAESLMNLSSAEAGNGWWTKAHETTSAAVAILEPLAHRSTAYKGCHAKSLGSLGAATIRLGHSEEALATFTRATTIYQTLTSTNSVHRADLARSLGNLGEAFSALGHHRQALEAVERMVGLMRELVVDQPVYLPDLPEALGVLSKCLVNVADLEKAISVGQEAVEVSRSLADNDHACLPVLARAIDDHGVMFLRLGRHGEAVPLLTEAVGTYHRLAETDSKYLADLAATKANLGTTLSQLGYHEEALRPSLEATNLLELLAARDAVGDRETYAVSLLNLGRLLWNLGRNREALLPSRQAVELHRKLAAKDLEAHGANLALALNNLGLVLWRLEQHEQALPLSTEAVALYRNLTKGDHRAGLAMALTNLAVRYRELGQQENALTVCQEAVDIRRSLVSLNPVAYLPDLALSLHNLGKLLAEVGRVEQGLAANGEAIDIYRGLVDANPVAYLPFLARALDSLGARLCALERLDEAASASQEAVDLLTDLAADNPVGTIFDLAHALANLSSRLVSQDPARATSNVWRAAVAAMASGCARALLRARWSYWYAEKGLRDRAADELRGAITDLDGGPAADGDYPALAMILTSMAREGIRTTVQRFGLAIEDLPFWATTPVTESHDKLLRSLAVARDWRSLREVLTAERDLVVAADLKTTLNVLLALNLDSPAVHRISQLLETIAELGLDAFIRQQDEMNSNLTSVVEWLRIVPWVDAMRFLDEHRDTLTSTACRQLLASVDHESSRQRLAALTLSETLPPETVVSLATDLDVAEEATLTAVDCGDLERLIALTNIAPDLQSRATTWLLAAAVVLVSKEQPDPAMELARRIAETGTTILRRAHVIRLQKFCGHHPELDKEIQDLIELIRP